MGDTSIEWTDKTKRCRVCREDKPMADFCVDRSRADGRAYVCRDCKNSGARTRYVPSIKPRRRHVWIAPTRNGDKRQARRRVNYLVEQGRIPRPDDLPCVDCGDEVFVKKHPHEYDHAKGYDGDNQLYVEPVCVPCHHSREEARRG